MLDICSTIMLYTIVSWNLFEYSLWFFNLAKDEWIKNKENLLYDESNPEVIRLRIIFFTIVFIITIPLFLKKTLDSL